MIGNQSYSESDSDDEECHRFFSVCAENKINAMIARMREYDEIDENDDRPEEFENEAVSMAIQQHGLKNYEREFGSEINENHCNQNLLDDTSEPTTSNSTTPTNLEEHSLDDDSYPKSKQRKQNSDSEIQNIVYKQGINSDKFEIDDADFLNEAVSVAISKKGLSSSSRSSIN